MNGNSRLVYSTQTGRIKTTESDKKPTPRSGDGMVRIRRESKGRKGKGVTTINGLLVDSDELKNLARHLKQLCGSGGCVKDGVIEVQGDHREAVKTELEKRGFIVKFAGG
ncbi:MAG: stress response translation initiation inhibitor YciH [Methylococcales bacterium]